MSDAAVSEAVVAALRIWRRSAAWPFWKRRIVARTRKALPTARKSIWSSPLSERGPWMKDMGRGMEPHYGLDLTPRARPPLRVLEDVAQRQYFVPQFIGAFPLLLHPRFISCSHKGLHPLRDVLFGGGATPEEADHLAELPERLPRGG